MKRLLLSLSALAVLLLALSPDAAAAQKRISYGQSLGGRLVNDPQSLMDGADSWFFTARKGDVVRVTMRSRAFRGSVFVNGPGVVLGKGEVGSTSTVELRIPEDGDLYHVLVSSRTDAGSGEYTLSLERADAGGGRRRSEVSRLQLSAGYGTVAFDGRHGSVEGGWKDSGVGPSGRIGLGLGFVSLFVEGQMSRMAEEGQEYDESSGYRLYHADLGSRLYLLGSGSPLRPYVQLAYGVRRMAGHAAGEDLEMEGSGLTPGAGVQLFLTPRLSIDGGYRRSSADYTRIRRVGDEWIDVPAESSLRGPSSRLSAQVVVGF